MQLVIRQAGVSLGAEAGHLCMVGCPPGCTSANEWVIGHLVTLLGPLKTLRGRMTVSCNVCDVFGDTVLHTYKHAVLRDSMEGYEWLYLSLMLGSTALSQGRPRGRFVASLGMLSASSIGVSRPK